MNMNKKPTIDKAMILRRLIDFIFGAKLPCGHCRIKASMGTRVTCPYCGEVYVRVKFKQITE